ncbi:40S ribosomal protein S10b [Drosophila ficusphila]|uniref:40S ribosomal protein S10b n=1 Tax=Drosophila ficusphila TaxID=30025 RepID=UPI0007E879FA|nr:40S ribosomal protein S10b [Drosophila ficusphila]
MFIPKVNRVAVYEYLFKEGVIVAKKDPRVQKHPDLQSVPNLQVIKIMRSLHSRGLVREEFAWRHFYWCLTNEGIEELRSYLHLPSEIVPSTLARTAHCETVRPRPDAGRSRGFGGPSKTDEDRAAYRRTTGDGGPDKRGDVGPGARDPQFRGGFGRGSRY